MKNTNTPHIYQLEKTDFNNEDKNNISIAIPVSLEHSFLDNLYNVIIPSEINVISDSHTISMFSIDNIPNYIVIHQPIQGIQGKKGLPALQAPQSILKTISMLYTKNIPYGDFDNKRKNPYFQSIEIDNNLTQKDTSIISLYTASHLSWTINNEENIIDSFFPYSQKTIIAFKCINNNIPIAIHSIITDRNNSNSIHSVIQKINYNEEMISKTENECIDKFGYYINKKVMVENRVNKNHWYISLLIPDKVISLMKKRPDCNYEWKISYSVKETAGFFHWRGWSTNIDVKINTPPPKPVELKVSKRII